MFRIPFFLYFSSVKQCLQHSLIVHCGQQLNHMKPVAYRFFFAPVLVHIFMIHRRMLCKIWSRIGSDNGVFWWSLSIIFISLPMTNRPPTPPLPPPRHQQYNTAYLYLCLMLANWSYNQSLNRYIVLSK